MNYGKLEQAFLAVLVGASVVTGSFAASPVMTFVPSATPSTNVYVGTVVTLTENPTGTAPFGYQWRTDSASGGATFSNISGANSNTLVVDTTGFSAVPVEYLVVVTNSSSASTSAPVSLTAVESQPVIVTDTLPATASDVVGGQIIFSAAFDGTRPITYQWQFQDNSGDPVVDIPDATNSALTISNLQLTDNGSYSVTASNALGILSSTPAMFAVNPLPAASNNVVVACANQTGLGFDTEFTPSWRIASNSLIAGAAPDSFGTGNFSLGACGVVAVLTDGKFGQLYPPANGSPDLVTCGNVGGGAGTSVTYILPPSFVPGSGNGYDITNIVTYGGWTDSGRDQQRYAVYYSTVASPTNFNKLADVNFEPWDPTSAQSATRATIIPATGTTLARSVAAIKFDFNVSNPIVENGYAGYGEIGIFGVPSMRVVANTLPATGSDVVGSTVSFRTDFGSNNTLSYQWMKDTGTGPVPIPGATNSTLILSNLQLSDSASPGYSLQVSNASGVSSSIASPFTVNPVPGPDANGIISAPANQTSRGGSFTPTWTLASGSLIAGLLPSSVGGGVFTLQGCGGLPVLTDGTFGTVGNGVNTSLASCGVVAGRSVTYTLTNSAAGYTLTNIVSYAGWSDYGRDQQAYTVSYATVANPTTFQTITLANYNPTTPGYVPSADRLTIYSATGAPIATNVSAVTFNFLNPPGENGYSGYAELGIYGFATPVPIPPTINPPHLVAGNLILTGSGGTAGGTYRVLTTTNVATHSSEWITNTTGVFNSDGTFSNNIPVSTSESTRFFLIKTP